MSDIRQRIAVADILIRKLQGDPDPRTPQAIAELERQRAQLVEMLAQEETAAPAHGATPAGVPPPVVVGLKPLTLRGKVGGTNG